MTGAQKSTALAKIQEVALSVPTLAQTAMVTAGFTQEQVAKVVGMCVALGVKPSVMANPSNLKAVKQAWQYMTEYNMIPGHHFYGVTYNSQVEEYDEDGRKIQAGWQPTLSIQMYYGTLQANVEEYGRRNGEHYRLQLEQVMDQDKREELIDFVLGDRNPIADKHNRVCKARYVAKGESPDFFEWQYGIYLAKGLKGDDGKVKSYGKATTSDFRTGAEIAKTRAIRLAARAVTANLYRVTGADAIAQFNEIVEQRAERLLAEVRDGEDLDAAFEVFTETDETPAEKRERETPARDKVAVVQPKIEIDDEGNINAELSSGEDFDAMWDVVEEQDKKKTGDTPLSPAQQIEAIMKGIDNDLSDEDRGMVSAIRTSTVNPDVPATVVANILNICRKCGGWMPGETFAGMEKAEIAMRFAIGAGPHDELKTKPVRALSAKIVEFGMKNGQQIKNLNYEEPYLTSMLFNICDIINALTE